MSRRRRMGPRKKAALAVSAALVAGGAAFALASTGNAAPVAQNAQVCQGLETAIANNQKFIDGQRAAPDAQSEARIANREAVIAEIRRKEAASGCEAGDGADAQAGAGADDAAGAGAQAGGGADDAAGGMETVTAAPPDTVTAEPDPTDAAGDAGGDVAGEQVCAGSTVTLSGEGGAPAASSGQFPAGTKLKVTNLDNGKSTSVEVTSASGSCVLLNNSAFEQVREPGKFLIRNARIEKVG
ncbi:septal ring lytic transglycosylase RlpA family protein [Streptomyces sp. NPDC056121]|uniref:septal ring lytic transglycosylase RlpA family protein n=1 Tax=Streptomyces TaxID=1883 RepID=UPI001D0B5292|nr:MULTISPECIES: septal ring lytic transglycosylase RlpA family protein [Streptomyces]MCX5081292.1 septal ring lytic transglycosylase RlpA family protein [Streptomyces sp. NBC_00401]UDL99483.1 septal ring lytic transglycosylase RlpA family protein [Streptomyces longhuiensis]